jgi:hypothetical protein
VPKHAWSLTLRNKVALTELSAEEQITQRTGKSGSRNAKPSAERQIRQRNGKSSSRNAKPEAETQNRQKNTVTNKVKKRKIS